MTQRCKKRLVKKYNTQSLHILRDHVRCAPAPRYNCPHLHFYFMLFCAPASHFTHPHLFYPSFPHPRSRRKVPNSAVWCWPMFLSAQCLLFPGATIQQIHVRHSGSMFNSTHCVDTYPRIQ